MRVARPSSVCKTGQTTGMDTHSADCHMWTWQDLSATLTCTATYTAYDAICIGGVSVLLNVTARLVAVRECHCFPSLLMGAWESAA